ncbi:MAG: hypothetical protein ACRC9P_07450, partial [Bacteroides sp.]
AKTDSGDWTLEIDNLTVRKVFQVFELIAQRIVYQGGMIIRSAAGGKITRITDLGTSWKCEHDGLDDFFKDDQVLCQNFKVKQGAKVKRYWRLAVEAGPGYVCLSKTDSEKDSSTPEVGDEIVQLGNRTNAARQNAQLVSIIGKDAPYIDDYIGINSYSLENKLVQRSGNLAGIIDKEFGQLKGSGIYSQNAYLKGSFNLRNGKSVETVISETSNKLSSDIGKVQADLQKDINTSVSSVKNELGATITNVENSFNTSLNSTKNELNSSINKVQGDANTAKGLAQSAQDAVDGLEIGGRNLMALKFQNTSSSYFKEPYYFAVNHNGIKTVSMLWSRDDVSIKEGDVFTLSYMLRTKPSKNNTNECAIRVVENDGVTKEYLYPKSREWIDGWVKQTHIIKASNKSKHLWSMNIYNYRWSKGDDGEYLFNSEVEYRDFKLERGNKPTDWTPAPEDFENQITEVKTEIKDVEQHFEIADGQINSHIKEATQLVTEAKLANGESVKTLEQVKVQINDINVTAGQINTTLGEVTKKQGEINSSISNLEQTAGSIKTSIEGFKETEAEIKATANKIEATHEGIVLEASEKSAQKAIDGLEIRVRNLLTKSGGSDISEAKFWVMSAYNNVSIDSRNVAKYTVRKSSGAGRLERVLDLDSGNYTISIWLKGDLNIDYKAFLGASVLKQYKDRDSDYIIFRAYFEVPVSRQIRIRAYYGSGLKEGDEFFAKYFKLEKGNKATDWTPAPEDFENQITETNAKLGVLNDQLLAEVSRTDGISKDLASVKLDHNSFKVQVKSDITGAINSNNELIKSSFEMKDNKISLLGAEIDITGKVTFRALDTATQSQINTALSNAGKAQTSADTANSSITALKGSLGGLAYEDRVELAKLGTTVIEGGFLKTDLIQANSIKAEKLDIKSLEAVRIRTSNLDVLSGATIGGFKVGEGTITSDPIEGQKWENLVIRKDFFKVGGTNGYAMLGEDVMPASLGNAFTAVARFENKQPNKVGFDNENIGLYVDVNGGDKNTTLYLRGGGVSGFGLTVRFLGNWVASLDKYNERWTDFNKVDDNSSIYYSDVTSGKLGIRLPYPSDTWAGRVIRFCAVNSDIYFHVGREGAAGKKYILKTDGTKHSRIEVGRGGAIDFVNVGSYWHYIAY